jgi:hypothetical protein
MLKRQMYGRAGVELLRARLLPLPVDLPPVQRMSAAPSRTAVVAGAAPAEGDRPDHPRPRSMSDDPVFSPTRTAAPRQRTPNERRARASHHAPTWFELRHQGPFGWEASYSNAGSRAKAAAGSRRGRWRSSGPRPHIVSLPVEALTDRLGVSTCLST